MKLLSNRFIIYCLLLIFIGLQFSCRTNNDVKEKKEKLTTVKFGMLPYGDHTNAIIGIKNGWFKEVGIDLKYSQKKIENVVALLKNRDVDVISTPPGILISAYDNAPYLQMFVYGDLFQGYAIMGRSDQNFKTFSQFRSEGLSPDEAIKATIQQMKGKVFAYPTDTAIKPFIDNLLRKADMTLEDLTSRVETVPLTVNLMRTGKADFQVGGVPSRITLQKEGFIPIVSSFDLAQSALPSPDSKELASIFPGGWAAHKDFIANNKETILKLASVSYRICEYINDNQEEALDIHMPYLTKVTGENFGDEEGKVIYDFLDPFVEFEDQKSWFYNKEDPMYYEHNIGSIINNFIDQDAFTNTPPTVEDIIYADDIYRELLKFKEKADSNFQKIEVHGLSNLNQNQRAKYDSAKKHYSIYNYLDAEKISNELSQAF